VRLTFLYKVSLVSSGVAEPQPLSARVIVTVRSTPRLVHATQILLESLPLITLVYREHVTQPSISYLL